MSRSYDIITFDCYGTLIDWDSGIANAFRDAALADGLDLDRDRVLEVYHAVEASKGELGFYFYSNGDGHPWRMKIRSPSFSNIQALPAMLRDSMVSDVVAIIGSLDPVMGEADK